MRPEEHTPAPAGFRGIPIVVAPPDDASAASASACGSAGGRIDTGNVPLLLLEVRHALERLIEDGSTHVIDVRAIPLGPGEEDRLMEALGRGEIRAEFDALGPSEVRECAYPGVWCVTHHNEAGHVIGRYIEVTFTPSLLSSPPEEVRAGLERLVAELAA